MAVAEGRRAVKVWFSPEEWAAVDGFAAGAGVETGALVREAALWSAAAVGREVSAGRVRLRRRSAGVPVSRAGRSRSSGVEERAAVRDPSREPIRDVVPAPAPVDPGVARAAAFRRAALLREERRRS